MKENELVLSSLPKTWIFDLDGTIVLHNGYLSGADTPILNSVEFIKNLPSADMVIFVTSRSEDYKDETFHMLKLNGIRYDAVIFGAPVGERILVNDKKPSGLNTAFAINLIRDEGINTKIRLDESL